MSGSDTGDWVGGAFATSHTLTNGSTYRLRISCAAGSTYWARTIRWQEFGMDPNWFDSWHFEDGIDGQRLGRDQHGSAEYTTNGTTWSNAYNWLPVDWQFYFTLA